MEGRDSKKTIIKRRSRLTNSVEEKERARKLSKKQQINKFGRGERKQDNSQRSDNKSTNLMEGRESKKSLKKSSKSTNSMERRESQKTLKESTNQQI